MLGKPWLQILRSEPFINKYGKEGIEQAVQTLVSDLKIAESATNEFMYYNLVMVLETRSGHEYTVAMITRTPKQKAIFQELLEELKKQRPKPLKNNNANSMCINLCLSVVL